jgi:acetyltransferase
MRQGSLDLLFRPRSVALFGADRRPHSIGRVLAANLFGNSFEGPILPVHAGLAAVHGVLAFRSVADLPLAPDLAVIASPAPEVAAIIAALGHRGTRVALVLSTDFDGEGAARGRELRQEIVAAARPCGLRIIGPACLGAIVPHVGLNASYAHVAPRAGDVALVTQSGSLASMLLDDMVARDVGMAALISLGDMVDVGFGDLLDHLAVDAGIRAILLAIDEIDDARRFMSAARTAARTKPVIIFDTGRSRLPQADGQNAGFAAVPRGRVFEAAFRRAGALPVPIINDLAAAAATLAAGTRLDGDRLAILCNGGGVGTVVADMWAAEGGRLASLAAPTLERLQPLLPPGCGRQNPVNIFADAEPGRYAEALAALLDDAESDAVLTVVAPTALGDTGAAAAAMAERLPAASRRQPLAIAWLDGASQQAALDAFAGKRVAVHASVRRAVIAFSQLRAYKRNQEMLIETPASVPELFDRDIARARQVIDHVLGEGRSWLSDPEAKELLAAYDLPIVPSRRVGDAEAAVAAAAAMGYPVALRPCTLESFDAAELGAIALDLENADAVRAATARIERRVAETNPQLALNGFIVHSVVHKADAFALRLGLALDPGFGPVIRFGNGGSPSRNRDGQVIGLPPLNLALARMLMSETTLWEELHGARGHPPAAVDEVAMALVRLSQIATDLGEVVEIDINPLLADGDGVVAVSARIRIAPTTVSAEARLAIRPYPVGLERTVTTRTGKTLLFRPIRPEDEPALQAFVRAMPAEDVRLRFFSPMRELDHAFAARLTQIDYDREMAIVAVDPQAAGTEIWGVMRIAADPEGARAEYAGSVGPRAKGQGLGRLLMEEIIEYCRRRGVSEVWGEVLAENQPMLSLARKLGFRLERDAEDPSLIHATKQLHEPTPAAATSS